MKRGVQYCSNLKHRNIFAYIRANSLPYDSSAILQKKKQQESHILPIQFENEQYRSHILVLSPQKFPKKLCTCLILKLGKLTQKFKVGISITFQKCGIRVLFATVDVKIGKFKIHRKISRTILSPDVSNFQEREREIHFKLQTNTVTRQRETMDLCRQ